MARLRPGTSHLLLRQIGISQCDFMAGAVQYPLESCVIREARFADNFSRNGLAMDETTNTPLEPQYGAYSQRVGQTPADDDAPTTATGGYAPITATEQPVETPVITPAEAAAVAATTVGDSDTLAAMVAPAMAQEASNGNTASGDDGQAEVKGISIIAREATVLGDIITEGHIDVIGKVRGNIAAQGDVAIHGQVRGNVGGEKIGLYNSRVKGNLIAGQGVIVNDASIIDGDVSTKNIIFDGKVRGSIEAESVVVLRSNSYCLGDVTAASIAVEPGAVINGTLRTLIEGDLEAPFDEII
jgi:cytoskeletal protein CcmA (bactofilin family)